MHEQLLHFDKDTVSFAISPTCIAGPYFFEEMVQIAENGQIQGIWRVKQDGATAHTANA